MKSALRLSPATIVCGSLLLGACLVSCGTDVSSASGSGGSGGSGPGSNTSSGPGSGGSGGVFELCTPGQVGLAGSLDGDAVEASYGRLRTYIKDTKFQSFFSTQGHVALFAASDLAVEGAPIDATGLFRMPLEGPSPGTWFCAGAGSSVTPGDPRRFALSSLSRLGTCPGTPVAGEITGCFGGEVGFCPLGQRLESTLDGASFDWTSAVTGWGGQLGLYEIFLNNGGILVLYIEADTVLGGLLRIAPGSPDEGAAYCFSGGALQPGSQNSIKFTLGGLSRLGTCPTSTPAQGSLEGCTE